MEHRRHTIVLMRGCGRELGRWEVNSRRVAAIVGGVAAIAGLAALSGWLWFSARSDRFELAHLRQENENLRSTNESFENRLAKLQERLGDTEDRTRKLAIVAGVESLGASREPGVGGELNERGGAESALRTLEARAGSLDSSLDKVETQVSENFKLLSSTPSIWPVTGLISSSYGWRRDPITGQHAYHDGIDISAEPGRPVQASASGVVAKTLQFGGLGRAVYVSHGFGVTSIYGHLSRVLVRPGQKVERGDIVGLVGNTGRATGYHLHYEIQQNGRSVNPMPYLLVGKRSR